jgi:hypothetical protein
MSTVDMRLEKLRHRIAMAAETKEAEESELDDSRRG